MAAIRCWLAVLLLAIAPLAAEASSDERSLARFLTNVEAMLDVPQADGEGERFDDGTETADAPSRIGGPAVLTDHGLRLDAACNGRLPGAHPVCASPSTGPPAT